MNSLSSSFRPPALLVVGLDSVAVGAPNIALRHLRSQAFFVDAMHNHRADGVLPALFRTSVVEFQNDDVRLAAVHTRVSLQVFRHNRAVPVTTKSATFEKSLFRAAPVAAVVDFTKADSAVVLETVGLEAIRTEFGKVL